MGKTKRVWWPEEANKMVQIRRTKAVTFDQRFEGEERLSQVDTWEKSIPGRKNC